MLMLLITIITLTEGLSIPIIFVFLILFFSPFPSSSIRTSLVLTATSLLVSVPRRRRWLLILPHVLIPRPLCSLMGSMATVFIHPFTRGVSVSLWGFWTRKVTFSLVLPNIWSLTWPTPPATILISGPFPVLTSITIVSFLFTPTFFLLLLILFSTSVSNVAITILISGFPLYRLWRPWPRSGRLPLGCLVLGSLWGLFY